MFFTKNVLITVTHIIEINLIKYHHEYQSLITILNDIIKVWTGLTIVYSCSP